MGTSIVQDFKLVFDTEMKEQSSKVSLGIIYEEEELGTISVSAKTGSGSKAKTPGSSDTIMLEDEDSVIEYLESVGWEKFASSLEKTDVPSEVVDIIEEFGEAVEDDELEDFLWGLMYMY